MEQKLARGPKLATTTRWESIPVAEGLSSSLIMIERFICHTHTNRVKICFQKRLLIYETSLSVAYFNKTKILKLLGDYPKL